MHALTRDERMCNILPLHTTPVVATTQAQPHRGFCPCTPPLCPFHNLAIDVTALTLYGSSIPQPYLGEQHPPLACEQQRLRLLGRKRGGAGAYQGTGSMHADMHGRAHVQGNIDGNSMPLYALGLRQADIGGAAALGSLGL